MANQVLEGRLAQKKLDLVDSELYSTDGFFTTFDRAKDDWMLEIDDYETAGGRGEI